MDIVRTVIILNQFMTMMPLIITNGTNIQVHVFK